MCSGTQCQVMPSRERLMLRRTISVRNLLDKQMWLLETMHRQGSSEQVKHMAIENMFYLLINDYQKRKVEPEKYHTFINLLPTWRKEYNYVETKEEFTNFATDIYTIMNDLFPKEK